MVSGFTISSTPIDVAQAGTYKASLVNFEFSAPFDNLALAITQNLDPLGFRFDTGSFIFDVPAPGTIMAHRAAIPIPPASFLFASAVIGLSLIGRGKNV